MREGAHCGACCTRVLDMSVTLNGQPILEAVNLHMHCGELTALIGPNGAGKTTLLRAMLGELPHSGTVQFLARGNEKRRAKIGYVPQKLRIDPDLPVSVFDLLAVAAGRSPARRMGAGARKQALAALEAVGGQPLLEKKVGELSGGELQRVLLAVAMTPVPDLLLLDEPVAGMDAEGLAALYRVICDLRRQFDISILLVTHDLAGIAPHADRIVVLNRRILAEGPPTKVLTDPSLGACLGAGLWNLSGVRDVIASGIQDRHD